MHGNKGKKQTQEHRNKINTPERAKKISDTLKRLYREDKRECWTKGKKLSEEHKEKIKKSAKRGKLNSAWKGNKAGYRAFHCWIRKHFGKANKCENRNKQILSFNCSGKSNNFEWAKIQGRRCSRKKSDYIQLCISCHRKYDFRPKNKKCKIKGCNNKHYIYGYCVKHARRFQKWGHPLAVKSHHNPIKFVID